MPTSRRTASEDTPLAEERFDAITDVTGIKVGHWTDEAGPTGCTVVFCEQGAVPGVDVRGGAPGTHGTDFLRPGNFAAPVHAILLTGGSAYGLEAASGVMRWCEEHGIGIEFGGLHVPIVAGAVIFDLNIGNPKVRPTAKSGYTAIETATSGPVAEGSVGAGTGATVAKFLGEQHRLKGGLGTASEVLAGGIVVGVLVVVNAVGDVIDSKTGAIVAGPRGDEPGSMQDSTSLLQQGIQRPARGNTTIGVVATNAQLTKEQASRVAIVAHDGLARAIRPVHTQADGDTIFTMATGERPLEDNLLPLEALAAVAVERAIVKAVLAATSLAGVPSVGEWRRGAQARK
jgi:L-aminopeptidase/D-esterase-like protein